jgi:hypothetical protein
MSHSPDMSWQARHGEDGRGWARRGTAGADGMSGHQPAGYFDSGRLATPTPVPSDAAHSPADGAGANHPRLTGECRTPGYAAETPTARESVELPLGAGASHRHEPDRPTAPGLPPRPIDYPRPQPRPS